MGFDQATFIHFLAMFMFLIGGGKGDMLDYVSSEGYWKSKAVQVSPEAMLRELAPAGAGTAPNLKRQIDNLSSEFDKIREASAAEIGAAGAAALPQLEEAARSSNQVQADEARRLIDKIQSGGDTGPVRRLMAIRALGELRHKAALPELTKLGESREPFVATYARRAVAAINGSDVKLDASLAAKFEADTALLPASAGIVAQYRPSEVKQLPLDELAKYGGRRLTQGADERRDKLELKLIELVERNGNARLDGITIGVADQLNNHAGFIVFVARGEFDGQVVKSMAKALRFDAVDESGKFPVYGQGVRTGVVMAPSSDRIVFMAGDRTQAGAVDATIAAARAGQGTLGDNKELTAMVQAADKSGPIWGVARVSDSYRTLFPTGVLNGVESGVLSSAVKDGKVQMSLRANAADADKAAAAVAAFDAMWKGFIGDVQRAMAREASMAPLADVLQGLQYKADGAKINADAVTADLMPGRFILPLFIDEASRELGLRDRAGVTVSPADAVETRAAIDREAANRAALRAAEAKARAAKIAAQAEAERAKAAAEQNK